MMDMPKCPKLISICFPVEEASHVETSGLNRNNGDGMVPRLAFTVSKGLKNIDWNVGHKHFIGNFLYSNFYWVKDTVLHLPEYLMKIKQISE